MELRTESAGEKVRGSKGPRTFIFQPRCQQKALYNAVNLGYHLSAPIPLKIKDLS